MKKLFLAALLLILVIVISYFKSVRQSEQKAEAFKDGRMTSAVELDSVGQTADSLRHEIGAGEVRFADSLVKMRLKEQSRYDSLADQLDQRDASIDLLKRQAGSSSSKSQPQKESRKLTSNKPDRHQQILAHYKEMYRELPTDLSMYERKVALNEIREETANKYKISLAELRSIRQKSKLSY